MADFTWLDWAVIVVVLLSALDGIRRGLVFGALDLLGAAVTVGAAVLGYRPLADWLVDLFPNLAPPIAELIAFLGLLVGAQVAYTAIIGWLLRLSRPARRVLRTLAPLDRALGALPGAVRGLVFAGVLLLPFAVLPLAPAVTMALNDSVLAAPLVEVGLSILPSVEEQLGRDLGNGLPGLILAPPEPQTEQGSRLVFGPLGTLEPNPGAEQQMLELINQERAQAGLRPLAADEQLRTIARAHSLEMFEQGYFAHESPVSGSPFDRMRSAGIRFVVAGENIAYAPNVLVAHRGLMNSPGHRANILRPVFGHVGIGIIKSQYQGEMFTQDFRD